LKTTLQTLIITLILSITSIAVFAKGGSSGNSSLGLGISSISPSQDDLNLLIERSNTSSAITTSKFGSAFELEAHYMYRFSGEMFAIMFRPSYFSQSTKGSGAAGDYNYSLSGWSLFPILRLYPLENSFIKFFLEIGLGYGQLYGDITEGGATVKFKGSDFGALGGLGAEFCFTGNHCMALEGAFRYLPLQRNLPSSTSGTPASNSFNASGKEVELDGGDMQTTMSGVLGTLGYTYYF
jgi:hypothetical protein